MANNSDYPDSNTASLRVVALAGGVGGAKLADGLYHVLPAHTLTVIVNTGDDFTHHGLYVSPDLDTVMYTLAGLAHPVNGWGLADDTHQMLTMLQRYGQDTWFGLGDRDLATNLLRTESLQRGELLSEITARFAQALGISAALLPMTDDGVSTRVDTMEHGVLPFQEYFVRYRWQPTVKYLEYTGAEFAQPAPGVLLALEQADLIVICPSNPFLSIAPILAISTIRQQINIRRVPCIVVSPIISGQAVKGPAAKLMQELGLPATASSIAQWYGDLIDGIVIDTADELERNSISQRVLIKDIFMQTIDDRQRLAQAILNWAKEFAS